MAIKEENLFPLFELADDGLGQHLAQQSIAASPLPFHFALLRHQGAGKHLCRQKEKRRYT